MKIIISFAIACLFISNIYSQVGIGTTNPSAELEIETTNTGIPALEINPQTAPVGNTMGQLAVIGDILYMYDGVRGKWLSVDSTIETFGRPGNHDDLYMRSTGSVVNRVTGILMPYNGTIVAVTVKTNSSSGAQIKEFTIQTRVNGTATVSSDVVTTAASVYTSTTFNRDFVAGNYITVHIDNDGNGNVNNAFVTLWIKWRQ